MKPAPFAYHAPETLDEALALLARGDDARVLAGGQSLVPLMKLRTLSRRSLVDVNRVPGLDAIEEQRRRLRIGALTRQQALLDTTVAGDAQPLLHAAGRTRATSRPATAAPSADRSPTPRRGRS